MAPSDDELDALERHGVDVDRVLGVLHAVLVAPGMVPPSQWLPVAFAGAPPEPASLQIVFRLYNHVGDLLRAGRVLIADPDDEAGRVAFAAGYAAGAALDPSWIGDSTRWTFASPLAYLAGRDDLVPPELRADLDADPESRKIILRDLDRIAFTTYGSFAKYRVPTPAPASQARSGAARPGRNEPCPCGSGKKYKRCCIDQA